MGYRHVSVFVLSELQTRAGKPTRIEEIAAATDLTETQIRDAIRSLQRRGHKIDEPIERRAWVWRAGPGQTVPPPEDAGQPATARLFELVGTAKGGDLILQDEGGALYRATELS